MLEARGLTKRYGGLLALDKVSFQLKRGEIVGYLGPNGSGKSTTVNIVVGLLEPSAGTIALDGKTMNEDPRGYKARIGYVPEEPYLYRWTTPVIGAVRPRRSNLAAIRAFTHLTLARSPLHQGVFVAIAACGAGLVLNSLFGVKAMPRLRRTYEDELTTALTWAPFALMFAMTLAVRAALVLPIEPRANWVFRMTEHDEARVDQIRAVIGSMVRLGVVVPLAILSPLALAIFGARAIVCTAIAFMAGLVLVELEMGEWRRIPFTCSYMPGKRFVGLTMLIGLTAFVAFTSIGSGLSWYGLRARPLGSLVVLTILGAVVWERRRRRTRLTRHTPLLFEDVLPNEVEPLKLSAY